MHGMLPKTSMRFCTLKVSLFSVVVTEIVYEPGWEYVWPWVLLPTVTDSELSPHIHVYS